MIPALTLRSPWHRGNCRSMVHSQTIGIVQRDPSRKGGMITRSNWIQSKQSGRKIRILPNQRGIDRSRVHRMILVDPKRGLRFDQMRSLLVIKTGWRGLVRIVVWLLIDLWQKTAHTSMGIQTQRWGAHRTVQGGVFCHCCWWGRARVIGWLGGCRWRRGSAVWFWYSERDPSTSRDQLTDNEAWPFRTDKLSLLFHAEWRLKECQESNLGFNHHKMK